MTQPISTAPYDRPVLVFADWFDPESVTTTGWAVAIRYSDQMHSNWQLTVAPYVCANGEAKFWQELPDAPGLHPIARYKPNGTLVSI